MVSPQGGRDTSDALYQLSETGDTRFCLGIPSSPYDSHMVPGLIPQTTSTPFEQTAILALKAGQWKWNKR